MPTLSLDLCSSLPWIRDIIAGPPHDLRRFEGYEPRIGKNYARSGKLLLVYATAQNLANVTGERWEWAIGGRTPQTRVSAARTWADTPIQPIHDGILVAAAGLALHASYGKAIDKLEEVFEAIALCNYFRHSLRDENGNDLNPKRLPTAQRSEWVDWTHARYISSELVVHAPRTILAFRFPGPRGFSPQGRQPAPELNLVRDPSWLKHGGMGEKMRGSVLERWQAAPASKTCAERLIEGYLRQMSQSPYAMQGMRERTISYLKLSWLEFTG